MRPRRSAAGGAAQGVRAGADAIVVLTSKSQTTEDLAGYYIDAVAIVYGKNPNIPIGPHISH